LRSPQQLRCPPSRTTPRRPPAGFLDHFTTFIPVIIRGLRTRGYALVAALELLERGEPQDGGKRNWKRRLA
jgi:hypothetical protein